jgi:predicted type IV restriction endonuclease
MDFADKIKALAAAIPKQLDVLQTEEATKVALVMPFIQALGYNVFDPTEVAPELVADVGTKRGEKVDYAILRDGKPVILFECKWSGTDLDRESPTQLFRYFSVSTAKFAVLTNGVIYRFFTDLDEPNKMDAKPFLEVNMIELRDAAIEELKRFTKGGFDLEAAGLAAVDLKYTKEVKRILNDQMITPSEDFVRFFASHIYVGKLTQTVRQQFAEITQRALQQFINDKINDRLKSALAQEEHPQGSSASPDGAELAESERIVTTEEEKEAYYIVKSVLREVVDVRRVVIRDQRSYCAVLLDDNNRKPICRFHFGPTRKALSLFSPAKEEERVPIGDLNDIYTFTDQLRAVVQHYDAPVAHAPGPDHAGGAQ